MKKLIVLASLFMSAVTLMADGLADYVSLRFNHENGVYAVGDTIRLYADLSAAPEGTLYFETSKYGFKGVKTVPVDLNEGENLLMEVVAKEPIHYVCALKPEEKSKLEQKVRAGYIVAPETFTPGFDVPADLYAFWDAEFKKMRKMKMKVKTQNEATVKKCEVYEVEVNCVGPKPVRAYVAHPIDAQPKSLPIIINLHAAGTPGAPSTARAAMDFANYGALAMDLNAHGMLNDQPQEYYKALAEGELNKYAGREPANRDDYYFKWMFLRAMRALDYMTNDPLWDGKHILVIGGSQGGAQSAFLAAMDPRVTAAVITVPAMLDQGASVQGRAVAWPKTMNNFKESTMANSPYFDPSLYICNTKAEIWCEIGMYDMTCPAPNIYAALNTVKTPVTIVPYQRAHVLNGPKEREAHKPVDEQRKAFIREALKR